MCREAHTNCRVACPSGLKFSRPSTRLLEAIPLSGTPLLQNSGLVGWLGLVSASPLTELTSSIVSNGHGYAWLFRLYLFFVVLFHLAGCIVDPFTLRGEVLSERGFTLLAVLACLNYVATNALNYTKALFPLGIEGDGHGARFVGALLVGLDARPSDRSLYSLRSLEVPAKTVGEWRRRHSLRRHKAGPGPQL